MAMAYRMSSERDFAAGLSRMSAREVEELRKRLGVAAARGVRAFDAYAQAETTTHPPMSARVLTSKRFNKITLAVSEKLPTYRYVKVSPGLDTPTTGRDRRAVSVTGWSNRAVSVPRGFVFNGTILQRDQSRRYVDRAKTYLIEHGALPSPAEILARCKSDVVGAVMEELYGKRG